MDIKDLFSLDGKTAVVTGGSRGIGLMIAEGFVSAGAKVYVTSRKAEACEQASAALSEHGEAVAMAADLSDPAEVERFARELADREERVHVLVNNAGTNWAEEIATYPMAAFEKVMNVNLKAAFHLTQQLLPLLEASATDSDPARVINIGSVDGIRAPILETYAYSSSKAALHQLSKHLARQLAGRGVLVNAIAPGLFRTKMTKIFFEEGSTELVAANIPLGRDGRPEEIAGAALFLATKAGGYTTGAVLPVDGGVTS